MNHSILLVDDDPGNISATRGLLQSQGYHVTSVSSGQKAIDLFEKKAKEFSVVLLDYHMPGLDGVTTAKKLLEIHPRQIIVIHSCDRDREAMKVGFRAGAVDFFEKDMDPELLLKQLREYCDRYEQTNKPISARELRSENERLIAGVGLVGASSALAKTSQEIRIYAPTNSTVMLRGETGTGKEAVARALHNLSARASREFVAVNCAAIPENLIESFLFGHVRGAFTGAVSDQLGKFALADGGTLFLDEIGDFPLNLQVKLLRALQEGVVDPVGARRPVKVDVRVLAATHKNIEQMVKEGNFREDLYYRLNVLSIDIPPLRERLEDIEPLVAYFTDLFAKKNGTKRRFERGTLHILKSHLWPGNVRELAHVVERHLITCQQDLVRPEDLDLKLMQEIRTEAVASLITLKDLEERQCRELKEYLESVLRTSESKAECARRLGISASHLQYYLQKHGITI